MFRTGSFSQGFVPIKPQSFKHQKSVRGYSSFNKEKFNEAYTYLKSIKHEVIQEISQRKPVKVTVTGAAGAIGYAILFRIASGEMLGKNVPVHLQCLEVTPALKALQGVAMELRDCAFPNLAGLTLTDDPKQAFDGAEYALLIGAKPRSKGMERGDLLKANAQIFSVQGKALNDVAADNVKVLVVGNPANTNAMITSAFAPRIPTTQITAMTQLDHNRGLSQLADKLNVRVTDIERFAIWGNHSATQYPDISHTQINGKWAKDLIDQKWYVDTFIPTVQQRGAAIIEARGASSAASAASAAIEHMHLWKHGTQNKWTSFAVRSDGIYGVDEGLWYSFPVVTDEGRYKVVANAPISKFSAERMEATRKELVAERDAVLELLKGTAAYPSTPNTQPKVNAPKTPQQVLDDVATIKKREKSGIDWNAVA